MYMPIFQAKKLVKGVADETQDPRRITTPFSLATAQLRQQKVWPLGPITPRARP